MDVVALLFLHSVALYRPLHWDINATAGINLTEAGKKEFTEADDPYASAETSQ
jgi:hypothetical protein